MKKNRSMRFAGLLFLFVLITSCIIGGSIAKYTEDFQGTDSARVAKFDVKVNGLDKDDFQTINLFDTIYDTKDANYDKSAPAASEADVASVGGDKVIAPGTWGFFDLVLSNNSEVTVEYTIDSELNTSNNIPLEFSTDPASGWSTSFPTSINNATPTPLAIGADTSTSPITVYWRWAFTDNADMAARDASDTVLGKAGTDTAEITLTINFTQVD